MADDPILLGLSGATFLITAESGGLVMSFSRQTSRKTIDVYDASVGKTTGRVFHDPSATYNVRLITTAGTGVPAASPGVALTLANATTGNGVSAGGIYTETTEVSHQSEQLREFTVTARQFPAIE